MRNLFNPIWLFIINTLPIVVLFFLFISQFNIIKSLLDPESIELWKTFGCTLGGIALMNTLYSTILVIKKKPVSFYYGFIALLVYIPFIYLYSYHSEDILPFSLPRWMVTGDLILYVGTFLMPTLVYSMFILVSHFTPKAKEHKPWISFLLALAVPLTWYIFVQIILPLWKTVGRGFETHAIIIFLIAGTVLFLFFLIRFIYILATKKAHAWSKYQLIWKIPFALIFPLLGLLINNGILFDTVSDAVFGDFQNIWFYILTVVNAVVLCLPNSDKLAYRLILFILRSITFAFTFYFFIVFLPFLPISVIAVVAFGLGFLMLSPIVLMMIHISELSKDITYLKAAFHKRTIYIIFASSVLVVPLLITATFVRDKITLNKTLAYLYTPDYTKQYDINEERLKRTLDFVEQNKRRNNGFMFGTKTPYISTYYNWLVLDNLTLSADKINFIESVFFDEPEYYSWSENIRNENVEITNSFAETVFDEEQKVWKSWINLEITNNSNERWVDEYATTIELPVGCWISDYYLYVGDRKEMGMLAEKKSAMWVYSQIRNTNRDPGILYYLTGNKVAFRVFPFAKNEVRKTGFELIHKEPVNFSIDGINFQLGEQGKQKTEIIETPELVYIPAHKKQSLRNVQRQPYFHFLIDVSAGISYKKDDFINRVNNLMDKYPDLSSSAKVSKVNSSVATAKITNGWENFINEDDFKGGFYLDRGIKSALVHAYYNDEKMYPVIIVVSDTINKAIIDNNFADLAITFPESPLFYQLSNYGKIQIHSLLTNPKAPLENAPQLNFYSPCLEYKTDENKYVYISPDSVASIALKSSYVSVDDKQVNEKEWASALYMNGSWISQNLNPERGETEWLEMVKSSFVSRIMTPFTSYLVVENDAQKAMLMEKQKQVLSGNKSLDAGEGVRRMSEPSLIILVLLLGGIMWLRKFRSSRRRAT